MDIIDIQKALKKQGFDPGPRDGAWGRRTIVALKAFQEVHGLKVNGIIGPETAAVLLASGSKSAGTMEAVPETLPLVWYEEAVRQLGTREVPGPASNPKILQWAGKLGIRYKSDDIPWLWIVRRPLRRLHLTRRAASDESAGGPELGEVWLQV